MIFDAIIDDRIRLNAEQLPAALRDDIIEALTIPNLEKEAKKKHGEYGWAKLDDFIELYDLSGGVLEIPRGFAHNLSEGVAEAGHEILWDDRRTWKTKFRLGKPVRTPRDYQEPAIEAIIENEQGIYKAPAGSGKTAVVLFTIWKLACKALVIVNTKDILWQWQERAEQFLGPHFPVGQIGDGKFNVSPYLTVATAQTINSRYDELLESGFFDEFSFVALDECHHATAETYGTVLNKFSSRYRIGVSATPDKTGDFALATNVLGPIFYTTSPKVLQKSNVLVKPEIVRVNTGFQFGFKGNRGQGRRSNYPQLLKRLLEDPERNEMIVATMMREVGCHGLCITKRYEHIDLLGSMLQDAGWTLPIVTLTGKDKNDHRQWVTELLNTEPAMCFSTLADEALDVPRLDRGWLVFPQGNTGLITQQVGRFERDHPEKKDARIYDFVDGKVGPLDKQWKGRRFEVYEPRGYTITRLQGVNLL